ncbi:ABC transporter substrate-binding protein [Mycolicibacterium hodleri]|uniref:Amino acid ABC transporter substrate-binding protein n=1 Tax=Mycolicibacterium hodleri TaxID=49897 RepID=A0A502EI00_9MYCO|nr:ABC transporter substrate-binding protein [Mycolicibacterium hodleri]TPG36632.1 amino acid ABC transporter substrate-binding protein [Mycolicibacterium hodleri]
MNTTKIGVLIDFVISDSANKVMYDAMNLAFDEALEKGLLDRPIELVVREAEGIARGGSAHDVVRAWQELKDEGVIGIYGPWASENAIALRSHVEEAGHVASLSMTGTDRWYGEWCFTINNGSLPEDPYLVTNFLGNKGVESAAVVYDKSAIGNEFRQFMREACEFDGIEVIAEFGIQQTETDLLAVATRLKAAGADAVIYCGFGISATYLNTAFEALGWDPLRVMTTSFMTAQFIPRGMASIRGWIGCDQYDEENLVGQAVLSRIEARYGYRPANMWSLINYDFAHVIAHAVSKTFPLSPEGFKAGLERVKFLPAANGGPRGLLSFGPYIRRGWLSTDFIVMREISPDLDEAEDPFLHGPGTVFTHRYQPRIR